VAQSRSDPKTGDAAGMLLQIPDAFLRGEVDFDLPRQGAYAVTSDSSLSDVTRSNMPYFEQLFVTAKGAPLMGIALDRLAYCLRRRVEHETGTYFASLSAWTIVYKGMLTTKQPPQVFPELLDERMASALVVIHSRFSPTRCRHGSCLTRTG
jgi:glutamate synthase (NADPH) large chain